MPGDQDDHKRKRDGAALPRDVQEHLGRRLRTALHVEEQKPEFLGDTNVPPQFAPIVRRLEAGARGERQGYEAVKRALGDLGPDPAGNATDPEAPKRG